LIPVWTSMITPKQMMKVQDPPKRAT
jgi:hypothetical protein